MDASRYFYSTDGTDAHGPVTEDELRQLVHDNVLGPASYLCLEGATEWQPLDGAKYGTPLPTPPPPSAATPPPFDPSKFKSPIKTPPAGSIWDNKVLAGVLYVVAAILVLCFAGTSALLGNSVSQGDAAFRSGELMGAFTASVLIMGGIPYFVSRFGKGPGRFAILFVGIFGLGFLTISTKLNDPHFKLLTQARAMEEQDKTEAQKEIAKNGSFSGDTSKANADLQKLKDMAGDDNSDLGRMVRDGATVMQDLVAKVKISNDAETACGSFDPGLLNSAADIDNLRTAIGKLRASQTDVLDFLNSFDDRCRMALSKDNVKSTEIDGFIAGARKSGHVDLLVSIWKLKIKLSDDHVARLDFLEQNWDHYTRQDGKMLFNDDASLNQFKALSAPLKDDIAQLGDLQRQIYQ